MHPLHANTSIVIFVLPKTFENQIAVDCRTQMSWKQLIAVIIKDSNYFLLPVESDSLKVSSLKKVSKSIWNIETDIIKIIELLLSNFSVTHLQNLLMIK